MGKGVGDGAPGDVIRHVDRGPATRAVEAALLHHAMIERTALDLVAADGTHIAGADAGIEQRRVGSEAKTIRLFGGVVSARLLTICAQFPSRRSKANTLNIGCFATAITENLKHSPEEWNADPVSGPS